MFPINKIFIQLRENLATIEKRKEKAEQNKKNFELRKYGKKVQQQVQLQRSKEKRDMLNQVKKYQKGLNFDLCCKVLSVFS